MQENESILKIVNINNKKSFNKETNKIDLLKKYYIKIIFSLSFIYLLCFILSYLFYYNNFKKQKNSNYNSYLREDNLFNINKERILQIQKKFLIKGKININDYENEIKYKKKIIHILKN